MSTDSVVGRLEEAIGNHAEAVVRRILSEIAARLRLDPEDAHGAERLEATIKEVLADTPPLETAEAALADALGALADAMAHAGSSQAATDLKSEVRRGRQNRFG